MAGKGSPGNPVKLASKSDPNGHNHATFPFVSQSSDRFYMINGDEWAKSIPGSAERIYQGGFHFIDFTDVNNPKKPRSIKFLKLGLITTGLKVTFYMLAITMAAYEYSIFPESY